MASPLLSLPDDLWHQLSFHLAPSSIFTLLQTSTHIHKRLRPLLPVLSPNLVTSEANWHHAILNALHTDHYLALFLLHLSPPFTHTPHPIVAAFHNTALADALAPVLVRRLVEHFLRNSCVTSLFQVLEHTASLPILLIVSSLPLPSPTVHSLWITSLIHAKTLRGESHAACVLLSTHPYSASLHVPRPSCPSCASRHNVLHIAAEVGDVDVVRTALHVLEGESRRLLNTRDCAGETPLSVAIRRRRSRVAQQLVRGGAEVRELVGCAARGGGALDAGDVWFKPVVDVD